VLRKLGIFAVLSMLVVALAALPALAQSGHFVAGGRNAPTGTLQNDGDLGISGKVAGLGGTTFEITASTEEATVIYACQNRGGNFPEDPKKETIIGPLESSTGELPTPANGQFRFRASDLTLEAPESTLDCPGGQTDVLAFVSYEDVTLILFEDGVEVDRVVLGDFERNFFPDEDFLS
jgi:hypothetical protein